MSQWINVGISILVVLAGTAVNLFILGRFVGQWTEAMKNLADSLRNVERRVEVVEDKSESMEMGQQLLDARVRATEVATEKFYDMRDAFIRMTTTIEMSGKQTADAIASLARGQSVIERQLATIATSKLHYTPGKE